MGDAGQTAEIRHTLRRVRGYWYRAGVPRRVRGLKAEELHAHLLEAAREGRTVEEVVGRDVAAFAAAWAEAERSRPLLDVGLQLVAAVTLLPGGLALLNPALHGLLGAGDTRTGLEAGDVAVVAAIVPVFTGWQLVRVWRHHLTTQQAALLGVVLFAVYAVALALALSWGRRSDGFLAMSPGTAWSLVVVGAVSQGLASWCKRSRWR